MEIINIKYIGRGVFTIKTIKLLFFNLKKLTVHAHYESAREWHPLLFGRLVRRHVIAKPVFPPCLWNRHNILFLLMWHVAVEMDDL
jgi:hypothetical protein